MRAFTVISPENLWELHFTKQCPLPDRFSAINIAGQRDEATLEGEKKDCGTAFSSLHHVQSLAVDLFTCDLC